MKRVHLFEFEDFNWFPDFIRDGGTDFLGFVLGVIRFYEPVVEVLENVIEKTNHNQILDLCSGSGGPIEFINQKIDPNIDIRFFVSDKYPNIPAYNDLKLRTKNIVSYNTQSLDVLKLNTDIIGIRTMFSAIHHFEPIEVKTILQNIVISGMPVCIFDSGDKHIGTILGILLFHPILFFICTPFIRPFKLSRIIFTYFIPLIPVYTIWDGVVSILRLYKPKELMEMAQSSDRQKLYDWKCGKLKNRIGFSVTYLIGTRNS